MYIPKKFHGFVGKKLIDFIKSHLLEETQIALFVDFANVIVNPLKNLYLLLNYYELIYFIYHKANTFGQIKAANIYLPWGEDKKNNEHISSKEKGDIEHFSKIVGFKVHPIKPVSGKDQTDSRAQSDAHEILFTKKEINTFIICAGDNGYTDLIEKIRFHKPSARIICFSWKNNTHNYLKKLCEVIYFDDYSSLFSKLTQISPETVEYKRLLVQTISIFKETNDPLEKEELIELLKQKMPNYNGTTLDALITEFKNNKILINHFRGYLSLNEKNPTVSDFIEKII